MLLHELGPSWIRDGWMGEGRSLIGHEDVGNPNYRVLD